MSADHDGKEMTVVEMHEAGMAWDDIAAALDTDTDDAMAQYRAEAYDHWDTGWDRDVADGWVHFRTGAIEHSARAHSGAQVSIDEIREEIPLAVTATDTDTESRALAYLDAETARELAAALEECADILEGKK